MRFSWHTIAFTLFALIFASWITFGFIKQPGYTDAFYYFNAGNRLASGHGLTDVVVWTYIGAPETLPAPSHLYWMPFTSLLAGASMWIFQAHDNYAVAQIPFTLMYAGLAIVTFWLGKKLGQGYRHAWVAGLLTLFSGFFIQVWGETDTFAPYAFVGSLSLIFLGLFTEKLRLRYLFLAGVFAGLGHLTRADGVLLLLVGWLVITWEWVRKRQSFSDSVKQIGLITVGYLLVMSPFFMRNMQAIGTPLPVGGTQSIWFTQYNDLYNFPPDSNPQTFFADGFDLLIQSRWSGIISTLSTFVAVEGMVVLTPLMLIALWVRRKHNFLRGFWLYALGLHLAMTFVFTFPGIRGGLFHSVSALIPFWSVLGVLGLDMVVDWVAKYRRTWQPQTAKLIFSAGLVVMAMVLSWSIMQPVQQATPNIYRNLQATLPDDARVMINDPSQFYYFTGLGAVAIPHSSYNVIPEIAERYQVTHLLIEDINSRGEIRSITPKFAFDLDNPPEFLIPIPMDNTSIRLYEIHLEANS